MIDITAIIKWDGLPIWSDEWFLDMILKIEILKKNNLISNYKYNKGIKIMENFIYEKKINKIYDRLI